MNLETELMSYTKLLKLFIDQNVNDIIVKIPGENKVKNVTLCDFGIYRDFLCCYSKNEI